MKAIRVHRFGGPEVLRLEEVSLPELKRGQVRVRVHAAGVNPVDTYLRSGSNQSLVLPYTPGLDAAGVVEAVGEDVRHVQPGDRIYVADNISGAYAEQVLCEAAQVHPLPQKLSFAQGAAIGVPYGTAYRALFQRGRAIPGETVLIHGASGGVGVAAIQLARAAGLTIIATAGSDKGRQLVTDQGAQHVLDHRAPDYLAQALKLTGGRGVNLLLEMLANVNLGKDLPVLASGGRVIVVGSRGKVEITPRDLMSREADVRGLYLFNASAAEMAGIHAALAAGFENGTLRPIIGRELPLADAARAHQWVMEPGAYGKIVLVP